MNAATAASQRSAAPAAAAPRPTPVKKAWRAGNAHQIWRIKVFADALGDEFGVAADLD